jgi:CRISPR-associated protein Cmr4
MANAKILYLHAITPIHSGVGHTVGVIDLPIAREKATGWPQIPGSSVKGVIRQSERGPEDRGGDKDSDRLKKRFGDQDAMGEVAFGDQRILFLAVRSFAGTFAYVTSPLVLERFRRDVTLMGLTVQLPAASPASLEVAVAEGSELLHGGKVYLEDIDLTPAGAKIDPGGLAAQLFDAPAEQQAFGRRVAVVPNTVFDFLCETATEITARVALESESKTVRRGGLWYEEAVPAESIFAGPVLHPMGKELPDLKPPAYLQFGGNATVGRGICRCVLK